LLVRRVYLYSKEKKIMNDPSEPLNFSKTCWNFSGGWDPTINKKGEEYKYEL